MFLMDPTKNLTVHFAISLKDFILFDKLDGLALFS
jgi:hypothetical protein